MVLPCFNKIKELYPSANLILLTNKPVSLKAPSISSILPQGFFSKEIYYKVGTRNIISLIKLSFIIRKLNPDILINLTANRSIKSANRDKVFFKLSGIKKIIGLPTKNDHNLLIDKNTGMIEWEAKRLKKKINILGDIDLTNDSYWDLHLSEQENQSAKNLLLPLTCKPFIVISNGTKLQANDWGMENWINLVKKLSSISSDIGLVFLGAQNDKEAGDIILKCWPYNTLNLCGKTSPRISAAILKQARLFIGHDSGPLHLGGAVGTPCIGIYSARNLAGRWFPRGDKNSIIYHTVECAGCGLEICLVNKKKCLLSISVEEVYKAVINTLDFKEFAVRN